MDGVRMAACVMNVRSMALPKMRPAWSVSSRPMAMETLAEAPVPIIMPKACRKMVRGKVRVSPAIAYWPTPWPIMMRSTML